MELSRVVESLLFATDRPLTVKAITQILQETAKYGEPEGLAFGAAGGAGVEKALSELQSHYEQAGSSLSVQAVHGGYLIKTRPEYAAWVNRLFDQPKAARLSQPALETLAVIAYRQPISRAEVEKVRGVAVDGVVATLLDRKLIRQAGRSDLPGKANLYETTPLFLELFGLKNLDELPNAGELRRLPTSLTSSNDPELIQPELEPPGSPQSAASTSRPG
jgi:segregation and condensation protein B